MGRVRLFQSCIRLFSALPLSQAVGTVVQLRKNRASSMAVNDALAHTLQQFLHPAAQLNTPDSQQACITLLKEMKETRQKDQQVTSLLQAFMSGAPDVKHLAEAYHLARQMLTPTVEFFPLAERRLLKDLQNSRESELMYEALKVYSGLGCAKLPISSVQKKLADVIDGKLVRVPDSWSKCSLFCLVIHTAAKISYASESLRSLLSSQLPAELRELEASGTFHTLGVVCSSACRLRLPKHHLEATVMPAVVRLQDELYVKHVVNIVFYLSEKSYYNREFFQKVMPALDKAVEREGVPHFAVMLNATRSKLAVMEAQLPS